MSSKHGISEWDIMAFLESEILQETYSKTPWGSLVESTWVDEDDSEWVMTHWIGLAGDITWVSLHRPQH